MKLSIVVPVYRVEATLTRCVESLLGQSFSDFEVILVDDASPDNSPQLCDQWAQSDSRIRTVHRQQNGGLSAARNTGLDMAQGEYVTFVDSDDYMGQGTLETVMGAIEDNDLLEYPAWCYWGSRRQRLLMLEDRVYTNTDDYWLECQAYLHTYAWNKICRRSLFQTVRFPEGKVFEDAYTLPRLLKQARRVATTSKGLYYYCWNSQGITATAQGPELRMLLDAHLTSGMPIDDRYYMHLVNIQIDVAEQTGDEPRLPCRRTKPAGSIKQRLKAAMLNTLGIKGICTLSKTLHSLRRWSLS